MTTTNINEHDGCIAIVNRRGIRSATMWIQVNKRVSADVAAKVLALLNRPGE